MLETSVKNRNRFDLSLDGYEAQIFDAIADVPHTWDEAAPSDNIFFQRPYFQLLERCPPGNYQFRYLVFFQDTIPVGVATLQYLRFIAKNDINLAKSDSQFTQNFKETLLRGLNFNILVCGNASLTGEYAFHFDDSIPKPTQFDLVADALQQCKRQFEAQGKRVDIVAFKEFYEDKRYAAKGLLTDKSYQEFTIQPTMRIKMRPEWMTFEDYLAAMSSKYRVRAKRSRKKAKDIEKRTLSLAEIEQHQSTIHKLYRNIADAAVMNVLHWPPNYFLELKRTYQDNFRLLGYFINDELVGFCTTIKNHKHLDAHFLGFDHAVNRKHQLYLNMLYDIVGVGIEEQAEEICMSRTALEIKSSVGAEPYDMFGYMRFSNGIINRVSKPLFNYLEVKEEWVQRKPFKEEIKE